MVTIEKRLAELPSVEVALLKHYEPIIREDLATITRTPFNVKVRYVEDTGDIDEVSKSAFSEMFNLEIEFLDSLTSNELQFITGALDYFCVVDEDDDRLQIDIENRRYLLGDGDDGGAVTFKENKFRIWLHSRHIK